MLASHESLTLNTDREGTTKGRIEDVDAGAPGTVQPVFSGRFQMRSRASYNLHVRSDALQEQGDKAKGSRGGITAVQQSCQSIGRGGCAQPTVSLQPVATHKAEMKALCCPLNVSICMLMSYIGIFYHSRIHVWTAAEMSTGILKLSKI